MTFHDIFLPDHPASPDKKRLLVDKNAPLDTVKQPRQPHLRGGIFVQRCANAGRVSSVGELYLLVYNRSSHVAPNKDVEL